MIKSSKTRLQVSITKELDEKLRKYCEKTGVSVSSFVSMAVSEKLMQYDTTADVSRKFSELLAEKVGELVKSVPVIDSEELEEMKMQEECGESDLIYRGK